MTESVTIDEAIGGLWVMKYLCALSQEVIKPLPHYFRISGDSDFSRRYRDVTEWNSWLKYYDEPNFYLHARLTQSQLQLLRWTLACTLERCLCFNMLPKICFFICACKCLRAQVKVRNSFITVKNKNTATGFCYGWFVLRFKQVATRTNCGEPSHQSDAAKVTGAHPSPPLYPFLPNKNWLWTSLSNRQRSRDYSVSGSIEEITAYHNRFLIKASSQPLSSREPPQF